MYFKCCSHAKVYYYFLFKLTKWNHNIYTCTLNILFYLIILNHILYIYFHFKPIYMSFRLYPKVVQCKQMLILMYNLPCILCNRLIRQFQFEWLNIDIPGLRLKTPPFFFKVQSVQELILTTIIDWLTVVFTILKYIIIRKIFWDNMYLY